MIAAVFKGNKKLAIEDIPLREIDSDELLIQVHSCGVCGTDYHILNGDAHSKPPVVPGHEFSGVISGVGKDVKSFREGDRIAVDPNIICGYCSYCRSGAPNHCENLQALGVDINGGFAEYVLVPYKQAYQIPDELSLEEAAFAEPLSCCIHGIKKAGIASDSTVIVVGGGSIGLMMVQLAKLSGASRVILIEPVDEKRKIGFELGADVTINPIENNILESCVSICSSGRRVVLECAGKPKTTELSINLAGKNGTVLLFGLAPKKPKIKLDLQYIFKNEIRIFSSLLNPFTFENALELISKNKINVKRLISKRTALKDIDTIFQSEISNHFIKHQITNHK